MKLISIKSAAAKLGVTPNCIRKWHTEGAIQFIKIGPRRSDICNRDRRGCRVREEDIKKMMEIV